MERDLNLFLIDPWKPITLQHINVTGEGPLHFKKRKDLVNYCKKHGLESGALL